MADRWRAPARYGVRRDGFYDPLYGMAVFVDAPTCFMGSVRGWLPVAMRRVLVRGVATGRVRRGAQFVLVCCDHVSPMSGGGVLVEQGPALAMGQWTGVVDDLAAAVREWQRSVGQSDVPRSAFVEWLHARRVMPRDAMPEVWPWDPPVDDNDDADAVWLERYTRTVVVGGSNDDDDDVAGPIETAHDDDEGAFWHLSFRARNGRRPPGVLRTVDGRPGLFWWGGVVDGPPPGVSAPRVRSRSCLSQKKGEKAIEDEARGGWRGNPRVGGGGRAVGARESERRKKKRTAPCRKTCSRKTPKREKKGRLNIKRVVGGAFFFPYIPILFYMAAGRIAFHTCVAMHR